MSAVDFSATRDDYVTHRQGYPDELLRRLGGFGVGEMGQPIVDLGTGTGYLARRLAQRGARVTGVDLSEALIEASRALDQAARVTLRYVVAPAEATGLPDACCDVVTAAQCWHWFDRPRAAQEARRLLRPGGRVCLVHFDWLPLPGNVVEASEALIARHNPAQPAPHVRFGGAVGVYGAWLSDLAGAGFEGLESFTFDAPLRYTHEGWRGRIRASQGVGAMLDEAAVARFDAEHAALLRERFPGEPLVVPHRAFVVIGERR